MGSLIPRVIIKIVVIFLLLYGYTNVLLGVWGVDVSLESSETSCILIRHNETSTSESHYHNSLDQIIYGAGLVLFISILVVTKQEFIVIEKRL